MGKRADKWKRRFQVWQKPKLARIAVYCLCCEMWFDSDKGWPVGRGVGGIPVCQHCGALLLMMEYDDFITKNAERLGEVMTWEWPDGVFWTAERMEVDER